MNELIGITRGFQTSVNIAYDLKNDDKIRAFIPTMSALDVIEDVMLSTVPTSTQRARVLVGAYGKGKSHIVLVLMSMLSRKGNGIFKDLFGSSFKKMKEQNPSLYKFVGEYIESEQKILPIVVRGNSTSLAQSFLSALQQTLSEEGLSDIMPETHFRAAINQIEKWRDEYYGTYQNLAKVLSKPVNDFILALNEYDVQAYAEFEQIYPTLTSGSTFNPFLGFDIVDIYENVTIKLKTKGYSGIYLVYDEFSKYLESSIMSSTNSDIKLLQDFAERCDRSGNNQMHLMLINHKDIANYIDSNLPKDKVDGWRGVSGRFKHVNLHNNYSQVYEIISEVIKKNPLLWRQFITGNSVLFNDLKDRFINNELLDKNSPNEIITVIECCFPLHPISTFILPRLSEKIAQNERTLFTFLSSDERYTLSDFLDKAKGFELLTPDYLYDYFEPLLRKEPYTSEAHNIYRLTANVLRRLEGKLLHEKIVKTLSLIYLVGQFEKLPPVIDIIVAAYRNSVESTKEIDLALKDLIDDDCVVYLKKSNKYLKIKESSGVDIREEINTYKKQQLQDESAPKLLNEFLLENFMYPAAYNDSNNIIRYFDFKFIGSREFWSVTDWDMKISSNTSDGVIYAIIPESKSDILKLRNALLNEINPHNRIVFIVPKQWVDIVNDVMDYFAVVYLKEEAESLGDEILNGEYSIYEDDLSDMLYRFINSYARPENDMAYYFYNSERRIVKRRSQLSALLSEICRHIFYRTPIINNESINKNELPTVAMRSRTKILTGLLASELSPNLGLSGVGQDVSMMRSTLIQTGLLEDAATNPKILLQPEDINMADLLAQINTFFTVDAAGANGANFKNLYDVLQNPNYGFGMKHGVIPIYIALVLSLYKENLVVLYQGSEAKITPELLNNINESPGEYYAILEDWNAEKAQYVNGIEKLFEMFITDREKSYNRFTYLFLAMNRWYLSLPKFTKEATRRYGSDGIIGDIPSDRRKFVNSLKLMNVNPREFLFNKVFDNFNYLTFNSDVIEDIKATKDEYDIAIENLIVYLNQTVKRLFKRNISQGTLTSVINDWYETISDVTKQYLFAGNENKILELMETITHDEALFIKQLAREVVYLRIEDWNDNIVETFICDLGEFKKTVEDFNNQKNDSNELTTSYEIIITDSNGNRSPKRFSRTEYSERAVLLRNEISTALEEMGQAITEQEKRQVLIEFLEELC